MLHPGAARTGWLVCSLGCSIRHPAHVLWRSYWLGQHRLSSYTRPCSPSTSHSPSCTFCSLGRLSCCSCSWGGGVGSIRRGCLCCCLAVALAGHIAGGAQLLVQSQAACLPCCHQRLHQAGHHLGQHNRYSRVSSASNACCTLVVSSLRVLAGHTSHTSYSHCPHQTSTHVTLPHASLLTAATRGLGILAAVERNLLRMRPAMASSTSHPPSPCCRTYKDQAAGCWGGLRPSSRGRQGCQAAGGGLLAQASSAACSYHILWCLCCRPALRPPLSRPTDLLHVLGSSPDQHLGVHRLSPLLRGDQVRQVRIPRLHRRLPPRQVVFSASSRLHHIRHKQLPELLQLLHPPRPLLTSHGCGARCCWVEAGGAGAVEGGGGREQPALRRVGV
ncbi:hypothetical protein V8C86DRAFT_1709633 [Haematococcus lacustris]